MTTTRLRSLQAGWPRFRNSHWAVVQAGAVTITAATAPPTSQVISAVVSAAILSSPVLLYALFLRWKRREAWSAIARAVGVVVPTARWLALGLGVGVAAFALTFAVSRKMEAPVHDMSPLVAFVGQPAAPSLIIAAVAYAFIATALGEELLFRGLIAGALFRRLSFWQANITQACIFVLPHLVIVFVKPELAAVAVAAPLFSGILFGWMRHGSGSVWPSWLVHAAGNLGAALAVMRW